MLLSSPVYAGERLPAGTVLEEESYVFTPEEAEKIMNDIQELEAKVEQQEEVIELYRELDETQEAQEVELEYLLEIRQDQISTYEEWVAADAERIKALERQKRVTELERWGFFVIGIVVASGAIIAADRLDDTVIENN